MMKFFPRFVSAVIVLAPILLCHCSGKEENPVRAQKRADDIRAIQNICEYDSQCFVTGCHKTLCLAAPDESFCEHRLVVEIEHPDDKKKVENIIAKDLGAKAAATLRSGGYASGRYTFSFHAPKAEREAAVRNLSRIAGTGMARMAPDAEKISALLADKLKEDGIKDVELRKTQNIGALVEVRIRSGDVLNAEDILATRRSIQKTSDALNVDAEFAYDVVVEHPPVLRIFPLSTKHRLLATFWENTEIHWSSDKAVVQAALPDDQVELLDDIRQNHTILIFCVGSQVIAPVRLSGDISDLFEIDIPLVNGRDGAVRDALSAFERVVALERFVRFDAEATARVENDIACSQKHQRVCACVSGYCQWRLDKEFQQCLNE